jgi:dipeptidyl aminopeptidase/acylaminoacyl peptidase
MTRLTFEGSNDFSVWTPDGKRVAYRSQRSRLPNLFWKPADGSGSEERLTTSDNQQTPTSFSPDGKALLYSEQNPKTSYDLWALPLEGERKPRLVLQTPFDERVPNLSPDGRWVEYLSNESGRFEVYAQPFPGPGGKYQISTEGGSEIFWGKNWELFYRTGANREKMMVVDTRTQPSFSAGKPRMLFEGPYISNAPHGATSADYSVRGDGQRFLMFKEKEQPQSVALTSINVVLNWVEELKQKVPVGKK